MTYVTPEDSISVLSFPARIYNCLRRNGIETVGQALDVSPDEWKNFPSLGNKSIHELVSTLEHLRNGLGDFVLVDSDQRPILPKENNLSSAPAAGDYLEELSKRTKNRFHQPLDGTLSDAYSKLNTIYVERMGLNVRAVNALIKGEIYTGAQLVSTTPEELMRLRNVGAKTIEVILEKRQELLQKFDFETREDDSLDGILSDAYSKLNTIYVERMGLNVRAVNALIKGGIYTGAQLVSTTPEELMRLRNVGAKTIEVILEKRQELLQKLDFETREDHPLDGFVSELSRFTAISNAIILKEMVICQREHPELSEKELIPYLWECPEIHQGSIQAILRLLDVHESGTNISTLLSVMPSKTPREVLDSLLSELESQKKILLQGEYIQLRFPTIVEYAQSFSDNQKRATLLARLHGETLEQIGEHLQISRERVRQKINTMLSRRPKLREDCYLPLFERYEFSYEEFHLAFDEPPEVYNYLIIVRSSKNNQRMPLDAILADTSIPESFRRKAERAIYRQYVTVNGMHIKKEPSSLSQYVVQTYCQELTTMEEFFQWYHLLLETIGASDDPSLAIDLRSYENKLSQNDFVLWNWGHRFRYYPIIQYDYGNLLEALALDQYENIEFSSLKLFRDNSELMEEYDIRDEYELHNLLKKILSTASESKIHFKKMPIIVIGTPNRDQQVIDLLMQCAPITNVELAKKYEELYGVRWNTAMANYFTCINQFFYNGIYRIDQPTLPENQHQRLAQLLTEDIYTLSEVKHIYLREFPDGNLAFINSFALKNLGFHVYTDYIISNRFSNASDFFYHLLAANDLIDIRPVIRKGGKSFYNNVHYTIYELEAKRELIEYLPQQYIHIRRLNRNGIFVLDLEDYCDSVAKKIPSGDYFTITSLQQDGFSHFLEETGFDEWFFSSILAKDKEHFSHYKIGKTRLFRRGKKAFLFIDFLQWLLEPTGKMDIFDLCELLEEHYNIHIDIYNLISIVRSSTLYYDEIMEAAYIDYDTYFEEV